MDHIVVIEMVHIVELVVVLVVHQTIHHIKNNLQNPMKNLNINIISSHTIYTSIFVIVVVFYLFKNYYVQKEKEN